MISLKCSEFDSICRLPGLKVFALTLIRGLNNLESVSSICNEAIKTSPPSLFIVNTCVEVSPVFRFSIKKVGITSISGGFITVRAQGINIGLPALWVIKMLAVNVPAIKPVASKVILIVSVSL